MARVKKPRSPIIDYIQYLALRVVASGAHSYGVGVSMELSRLIGRIMYVIDKRHRDRAIGNLKRSFPDMPDRKVRKMAKRSMEALCMLGCEVMFTTRIVRVDTFRKYVTLGPGFDEVMKLLLRKDQGLILLTAHYGNWEILGYVLATMGFGTTSVARPLDNPWISDYVFGVRERTGQRIINKKSATLEVTDLLDNKQAVAFVADQNAGKKGMFVDFFGRKASAYKSIGLLAMKYEVPVVIGYARRLHDRFSFECACQDIIQPADWKDKDDPLLYITQRYTKAIEDFVRADPGQYLWVHRRWKTRPKGEAPEKFD
jgi:KDO2-lipid IV(A) lauroyltransferase